MEKILFLEKIGVETSTVKTLLQQHQIPLTPIFNYEDEVYQEKEVAVIVNVKKKLSQEDLQKFPNLKMIAVSFTGYDSVCEEYCRQNDIAVYNAAGYATDPVAELTVALSQSVLRKLAASHSDMKQGTWKPFVGQELANKTVGIIGTGEIGVRVAEIFKAYKCNILGYSRSKSPKFQQHGNYVSWDELFQQSDIVTVHIPLNKDTQDKVGTAEFQKMKNSAIFINTARGPIISRDALVEALKQNQIAGAGLDVYASEPLDDLELQNSPNIVLMPHLGFRTKEALHRKARITIDNIGRFITKKGEINRVI